MISTNGKQVPWDHSALTGDFYHGAVGRACPAAESEALQQRLRQVEEELKKKSDPQHTAKLVDLAQFKERIRQIEEANRADQQRIFETHRKYPAGDPASRASANREVGAIQLQMVRRNEDRKKTQRADRQARSGGGPGAGRGKVGRNSASVLRRHRTADRCNTADAYCTLLLLRVQRRERAVLGGELLDQRRDLPARTVLGFVGLDALGGLLHADHVVDLPHGPAAPGREAVAVEVHRVDVAGAQRDAFLEDLGALVGEPEQAALDDLVGRESSAA